MLVSCKAKGSFMKRLLVILSLVSFDIPKGSQWSYHSEVCCSVEQMIECRQMLHIYSTTTVFGSDISSKIKGPKSFYACMQYINPKMSMVAMFWQI